MDIRKEMFDAYADCTLQIGYNSLFAASLPLASFYALMSNIFLIRNDASSWFLFKQRPEPKCTEDIGAW